MVEEVKDAVRATQARAERAVEHVRETPADANGQDDGRGAVDEPWPGYDDLTVAEIEVVLEDAGEQQAEEVAAYERAHKNRAGVLRSVARETATT